LRDHNRTWQPKKGELVRRAPSDIHTAGTRCQGCGRREPPKVGFTSVAPPRLARPATHDAAIGALRPFVVRSCVRRPARQSRARAGCSASPRRSALRADSPALLGLVARRQTHCAHFVRCVQTNGDKSVVEARCARGPRALRCSAPQRRCAACPGAPLLQRRWCSGEELHRCLSGRRYSAGAISVATSSAGPGSARASALRCLTRRGCLNAANAVSAVSSAARPRTEQRSAVAAKRRPPQHEPPAGTACRDARTSQASGCSRTAATGRQRPDMHNSIR